MHFVYLRNCFDLNCTLKPLHCPNNHLFVIISNMHQHANLTTNLKFSSSISWIWQTTRIKQLRREPDNCFAEIQLKEITLLKVNDVDDFRNQFTQISPIRTSTLQSSTIALNFGQFVRFLIEAVKDTLRNTLMFLP